MRNAASKDGAVQPYLTNEEADALYNLIASFLVSEECGPDDTLCQKECAALARVQDKLMVR